MSNNDQQSSSVPSQLAALAIKALKPGGITVGGGYGLWLLFIEHKSAEAIASALIGFCFSYLGKLLEPIHVGNQRRLENVGKAIDQSIDHGLEAVKWRFSGCDGRYLQRQGERCQEYYGTEDFKQPDGIWQINLDDVFVPLNLDLSVGKFGGGVSSEERSQTWQIWDFLAQVKRVPAYRFIAILADGGSGKTTLMRHVTYKYAKGQQRKYGRQVPTLLPFLIFLRKWRDVISENPSITMTDLMMRHLQDLRDGPNLKVPSNWAENKLKHGLIMFDGFDEVAKHQRQTIAEWISRQVNNYPNSVFLLTSRPGGYDDFKEYATEQPTTLRVREFEKIERDTFVQKWYLSQELVFRMGKMSPIVRDEAQRKAANLIGQIDSSPELQKMSGNPLLLNLIARLHKFYPNETLPQLKTELYQEICDLQLGARPSAKRVAMLLDKPLERQQVLQAVALEMVRQNTVQIEKNKLLELIRLALAKLDETADAQSFLKQMVQISELLYEPDTEEYAFSHLSFRNYLAALEISRLNLTDELIAHWHEDWWRETILMYCSQLKPLQLHPLAQAACNGEDKAGNVYLAYDCLVRHPSERIEPDWISELQPLRYQRIEQFMQQGQWREADIENYRLMIQTCGKDFGEYFTVQDLETFPCWDLQRLNSLWLQYSGEKFGFSVQKKIWEECGSPKGYDLTDEERQQWILFCDRVGWRIEGEFMDYENLQKNPSISLQGELPSRGGWWSWVSDIFSRAKTCGL
ncbi:GUN4 domain-containing protein [filamentous cyanobacterium LEGE 11480]|uniref:GUN4 domain-containing protein n=1 Tax=Romeriopsis navalis LEGE 11480 TaxID=2777977 RepID=A0A928VM35_9CYAN|nr:GUN4 domain-containing protein [Romeriopsis navalis]MBE9029020.1 GUN4 domain-containing protein [Romeriopsis navalis LEGE 11480]